MWTGIETIKLAKQAGDGYAAGVAVGDLCSLFLDSIL